MNIDKDILDLIEDSYESQTDTPINGVDTQDSIDVVDHQTDHRPNRDPIDTPETACDHQTLQNIKDYKDIESMLKISEDYQDTLPNKTNFFKTIWSTLYDIFNDILCFNFSTDIFHKGDRINGIINIIVCLIIFKIVSDTGYEYFSMTI